MKKTAINLALVLAATIAMSFDYYASSQAQNLIAATCDTSISYDKSGDMYCADTPHQSTKLAQQ